MLVVDGIQVVRVLPLGLSLLLGVDGRDIGGGLRMGRRQARLFPMPDEVLQILYRTHGCGGE